ncbi:DUF2157 domain-containing protein [Sulfurimonas marina]|uniref:DUF2157 domain-containing protein n=1 Tax=Sulfurimonas marina TaxID=2590551 RepID=A0A7M1AUG4_9BACT|nr:DUF2157 domain-containing protein [Sulfurimonas marina]QOP41016.1 DUF2157 domain-containing protein [Sulfurimonas marina]
MMKQSSKLRSGITFLLENNYLKPENTTYALKLSGISPDALRWRNFIDTLLLVLAGLAIAVGIMFFIAYNWDEIGKFTQFSLVEISIIISMIIYFRADKEKIAAKIALTAASILLGVLLALFGQTYQTGADTWELFFNWALLILPWVFIGRFATIWVIWIVLIDISILLYYKTFGSLLGTFFSSKDTLLWSMFIFNTAMVLLGEVISPYQPWLKKEYWAKRFIMVIGGSSITWLVIVYILDRDTAIIPTLVWILYLTALYFIYRNIKHDLFMLAGGCFSAILVVTVFLGKHLTKTFHEFGLFLLMFIVVGMGALSAIWLKNLYKEWHNE